MTTRAEASEISAKKYNDGVVYCKSSRDRIYNQDMVPKTNFHIHKGEEWDRNAPAVSGVRKSGTQVRKVATRPSILANLQKRIFGTSIRKTKTKYSRKSKNEETNSGNNRKNRTETETQDKA